MISAVFPVYNERENINPLVERLLSVLGRREELFELIGVDDGSRDRSFEELTRIAGREPRLKVIQFSRNFGQTAALAAGIAAARGDVIVTIDSDLENDPEDIPRLLEKLKDKISNEVLMIVAQHHESLDGSGFPAQLKGLAVYDLARIVTIANVYDNLVSKSAGKTMRERQEDAMAKLESSAYEGKLDPKKLEKSIKILKYSLI